MSTPSDQTGQRKKPQYQTVRYPNGRVFHRQGKWASSELADGVSSNDKGPLLRCLEGDKEYRHNLRSQCDQGIFESIIQDPAAGSSLLFDFLQRDPSVKLHLASSFSQHTPTLDKVAAISLAISLHYDIDSSRSDGFGSFLNSVFHLVEVSAGRRGRLPASWSQIFQFLDGPSSPPSHFSSSNPLTTYLQSAFGKELLLPREVFDLARTWWLENFVGTQTAKALNLQSLLNAMANCIRSCPSAARAGFPEGITFHCFQLSQSSDQKIQAQVKQVAGPSFKNLKKEVVKAIERKPPSLKDQLSESLSKVETLEKALNDMKQKHANCGSED